MVEGRLRSQPTMRVIQRKSNNNLMQLPRTRHKKLGQFEDELRDAVHEILNHPNLEELTCKKVRYQLQHKFGRRLYHQKKFITATVKKYMIENKHWKADFQPVSDDDDAEAGDATEGEGDEGADAVPGDATEGEGDGGAVSPRHKIGESDKLVQASPGGTVELTPVGHLAADIGEKEHADAISSMHSPYDTSGRPAKVEAAASISKVVPLTMTRAILQSKIWGGKRGELWKESGRAALVEAGCDVAHFAGRYVGKFRVLRARQFHSAGEALDWLGHAAFAPQSRCRDETLSFYHTLFTGVSSSAERAGSWDDQMRTTKQSLFYAWEDVFVSAYIAHHDGNQPWTHPQDAARGKKAKEGNKKAASGGSSSSPRKTAKDAYRVRMRGWLIKQGDATPSEEDDLFVLKAVTRVATTKKAGLKVRAGHTAFEVVVAVCTHTHTHTHTHTNTQTHRHTHTHTHREKARRRAHPCAHIPAHTCTQRHRSVH